MKRFFIILLLLCVVVLMITPNSYAIPVNLDTIALNSWGRLYGDGVTDQNGDGAVEAVGAPVTNNPAYPPNPAPLQGYSFDNPYNPGVNNPTQGFVPNVYKIPDGTEDSWGITGLNAITTPLGAPIMAPSAGKEWAIFFYGADDVLVADAFSANAHPLLGSGIYSSGVIIELWETNALDGSTYSGTTVGLGTGGRLHDGTGGNPLDPTYFDTITGEAGGKHLLTLSGHSRYLELNSLPGFQQGHWTAGGDETDGAGAGNNVWDVYDQFASTVGPPFVPPFTFANNSLFDVVAGAADPYWEYLFNSDSIVVPNSTTTGLTDFAFSGQFFDNRVVVGAGGVLVAGVQNGNNLPNPDDMWTVYNQPSVQADMVPEPGTMLLLGSGLLGLAGFGRKKLNKKNKKS